MTRGSAPIVLLVATLACGRPAAYSPTPTPQVAERLGSALATPAVAVRGGPSRDDDAACAGCASSAFKASEVRMLEQRIGALKAKGGDCATYAIVLEKAYRSGQITIRPYMWRVGVQLASGEAHPNGEIILAREIDSLNVGRRTFDELVWTMEHEAAHLAFNLDSPLDRGPGDRADAVVRSCRS